MAPPAPPSAAKANHVKRTLLALLAATVLAAAGFVAPSLAQAPQSRAEAPKTAAKSMPAPAARDTLGRLRSSKQITVAVSADSLPFSFINDKREPDGYSIDLCKRVIAQLGRAAGVPDLKVNWVTGGVAERIAMVASGKADLDCANTTATLTRMKDVDFSSLIFLESGGVLVKRDTGIQKLADLDGKNIGVIAGTTTEARLDALLRERLINAKVTKLKDGTEGIAMLESGSLDAFASDKIRLVGLALQAKDAKTLEMMAEDISIEPLAFALPRGDSAFRLEVNRALTQVYVSGEIEAIFKPWLGALGRPSGLLAAMYLLNAIPQ
jgi:glutamate/aspartate transport system substrate-binding protein